MWFEKTGKNWITFKKVTPRLWEKDDSLPLPRENSVFPLLLLDPLLSFFNGNTKGKQRHHEELGETRAPRKKSKNRGN